MKHLVTIAFLALSSVLAGCPKGGGHPAPMTSDAPPPPPGYTFALPSDLCTAVDWSPFEELYPSQKVRKPEELPRSNFPGSAWAKCMTDLGRAKVDMLILSVEVQTFTEKEKSRQWYEGRREGVFRDSASSAKDVSHNDYRAYTSIHLLGPQLVAHTGNAYIALIVGNPDAKAEVPSDSFARLQRMAEHVIAHLPRTS